jgi:hypothetical protein
MGEDNPAHLARRSAGLGGGRLSGDRRNDKTNGK